MEEGDVLFAIDLEDLASIMEEKQNAIARIQTQVDTILANEELARQRKALEEQRAREDYDELARHEDTLVGRAAEAYSQIKDEIGEQREGSLRKTADISAVQPMRNWRMRCSRRPMRKRMPNGRGIRR